LVAGLRGAADHSGDGQVTLSEAFGYANRLTIRDTATRTREAQHPSFDFRLRGRQDVVLTSVQSAGAQLVLAQDRGPLEVVQLSTGLTVVEAMPGERVVRLTLPPGGYLVRRVLDDGRVRSREVQVKADQALFVEEASLTLVGAPPTASKGVEPSHLRGRYEFSLGMGAIPLALFSSTAATFWSLSGDATWFFSGVFGLRATVRYTHLTEPNLIELQPALVAAPSLLETERQSMRLGLSVGLGPGVWSPDGNPDPAAREFGDTRPFEWKMTVSGALGVELTWVFFGSPRAGGWGVRLGANLHAAFPRATGLAIFPGFHVELVTTQGAAR
ncbi:MAG: hypothetical protein JNG84_11765, partial [Archangium sp.]|nr:hypothetical protein [Archangium sp.]